MAKKFQYTISGFVPTGMINATFTSRRQLKAAMKKARATLSDHYYYALQVTAVDLKSGEVIGLSPKKKVTKESVPDLGDGAVAIRTNALGMVYFWKGKKGVRHFEPSKSYRQNMDEFQKFVTSKVGVAGWMTIKRTSMSIEAYQYKASRGELDEIQTS